MRTWHSIWQIALLGAPWAACAEPECPVGTVQVGNVCRRVDAGAGDSGEPTERQTSPAVPDEDSGAPPVSNPPPASADAGRGFTPPTVDTATRPEPPTGSAVTEAGVAPARPFEPAGSDGGQSGVCLPGTLSCDGRTPRACLMTGQWMDNPQCPFACQAGQCIGTCVPESRRCDAGGRSAQVCSPTGSWDGPAEECPSVCVNGGCAGTCVPGAKECVGNTTTQQTCDGNGAWQRDPIAVGICGAQCTPRSTGCFPNSNRSATCDAQGRWVDGTVSTACGAACVPPQTRCDNVLHRQFKCTTAGTWDAGRVVVNQCGATCTPGVFVCSSTMDLTNKGAFAVPTPNTVFHVTCDATGQPGPQVFCNQPCQNFSCPAQGGFLPTAYLCDATGAAPRCIAGGACPPAASLGVPGC